MNSRQTQVCTLAAFIGLLGLGYMLYQRGKKKKPSQTNVDKSPAAKKLDFSEGVASSQKCYQRDVSPVPLAEEALVEQGSKDCTNLPPGGDGDSLNKDEGVDVDPEQTAVKETWTAEIVEGVRTAQVSPSELMENTVSSTKECDDSVEQVVRGNCTAEIVEDVIAAQISPSEMIESAVSSTNECAGAVEQVLEEECIQQTEASELNNEPINSSSQNVAASNIEQEITSTTATLSFTANAETDITEQTAAKPDSPCKIKVVSASSLRSPTKPVPNESMTLNWAALADNENNENCTEEISRLSGTHDNTYTLPATTNSALPTLEVTTSSSVKQNSSSAASPADDMVSSTSSNSDHSEVSCDSGKGVSIGHIEDGNDPSEISDVDQTVTREFEFPTDLCGLFIGKKGKNINEMKSKSEANIALSPLPYTQEYQCCTVKGTQAAVNKALKLIQNRFAKDVDTSRKVKNVSQQMMISNESMQLSLPEGVAVDVVVSSIVSGGHVFVQQMTHPSFTSLERLNQCMLTCYAQAGGMIVPQLPRPVEAGVICAAPMMDGWYRAQVVSTVDDTDECYIRYVDYGGYALIPASQLRQIRSDFMSLPFQAAEGYLANVVPLKDETEISVEAGAILEELTQGYALQCHVSGYADDGVPYLQLYNLIGGRTTLVNRELVSRGVVRWVESQ